MNYSFILCMLQLSPVKQQIISAKKSLFVCPLQRDIQSRRTVSKSQVSTVVLSEFVAYINVFVGLRRIKFQGLAQGTEQTSETVSVSQNDNTLSVVVILLLQVLEIFVELPSKITGTYFLKTWRKKSNLLFFSDRLSKIQFISIY